jgi:hypothetical protein
LNRKVEKAKRFGHGWYPNDKRPILGVNEDPDTRFEDPYIVLRNVTYVHALLKEIVIEEGFLTDLGSIPWLLKWIPGFRPTDPGLRAFLVHDVGYRKQLAERRLLDTIMESGLIADGMKPWKAKLCYWGVRLGGRGAYKKHERWRVIGDSR